MKAIRYGIMALIAGILLLLTACKTDPPTIHFEPLCETAVLGNSDTGDTVWTRYLTVTFTADAGIAGIDVTKYYYKGDVFTQDTTYDPNLYNDIDNYNGATSWERDFVLEAGKACFMSGVTKVDYKFEVFDEKDASAQKVFTILRPDRHEIRFHVTDSAKNPIKGAKVELDTWGTVYPGQTATTDDDGYCAFQCINERYRYQVTKDRYKYNNDDYEETKWIEIRLEGEDIDLTIELDKVLLDPEWTEVKLAESGSAMYHGETISTKECPEIGVSYLWNREDTATIYCLGGEGFLEIPKEFIENTNFINQIKNIDDTYKDTEPDRCDSIGIALDVEAKAVEPKCCFITKVKGQYAVVKVTGAHKYSTGDSQNRGSVIIMEYKK